MKAKWITMVLAVFFSGAVFGADQDSTGMPGDNLDLYAVLDLFKKSNNLEDFEKSLNDPNNKVNNLDLNHDGQIDYIRVVDHAENDAHAIVLQVPINEKESQDVAVIEVEKDGVENARIQIVGNDDVYGDDYVVEPYSQYVTKDQWDAEHNTTVADNSNNVVVVNVWTWPCVTYIYTPYYRPWNSPWYWGYYPGWWRPWRPYPWHTYYGFVGHYHTHTYYYHHAPFYRVKTANQVYHGHRTTSETYRRSAPVARHSNTRMAHERTSAPVKPRDSNRSKVNPANNNRSREKVNTGGQKNNPAPRTNRRTKVNPAPRPGGSIQPRQRSGGQPRMSPHRGGSGRGGGRMGGGGHRH